MTSTPIPRRRILQGMAAGAGLVLTGYRPAFAVPGQAPLGPGSRPDPSKPEGADPLPQIEHIVIYMQENHSYDSYFGMLGRGDGYTIGPDGQATNSNRNTKGEDVRVSLAPSACQLGRGVSQSWANTHTQVDGGAMDGFLHDDNENAMHYWDRSYLPFYWSLAETFPLCDRWFTSAPCQTYPNRMYLQAGTSQGLVSTDTAKALALPHPKNGTIWDKLNAFGISWHDYAWDLPDIALFPKTWNANKDKVKTFNDFLLDCRSGSLASVNIVSPGVAVYTEENPADVQLGEAYSASVINAIMQSPAWPKTVLLFMYDEHGGYYDHVAPPATVPPDDIPPDLKPTDPPGAFDVYGPRVPGFVISPFSKRGYVSSVVHDHTSVLRLIETKFNLGALTRRDANASNLLDSLDFADPGFLDPPELAAPGLPASGSACESDTPPPPTSPTDPSTPTTTAPTTTAPLGVGAGAGSGSPTGTEPGLARTGSEEERHLLLGLCLLGAGATAFAAQRSVVKRAALAGMVELDGPRAAEPGAGPTAEDERGLPAEGA